MAATEKTLGSPFSEPFSPRPQWQKCPSGQCYALLDLSIKEPILEPPNTRNESHKEDRLFFNVFGGFCGCY